jgi:hypothetical protein
MAESGHAACSGIDIIIIASADGVEFAVGAATPQAHDLVCAESRVLAQEFALPVSACGVARGVESGQRSVV